MKPQPPCIACLGFSDRRASAAFREIEAPRDGPYAVPGGGELLGANKSFREGSHWHAGFKDTAE